MQPFSEDTTWVTATDIEKPLYMSLPIILRLATIHYYSLYTFSYISLPVDIFERDLIDYRLIYIANTHTVYSRLDGGQAETSRDMVQLVLTVKGQEFLKKVPQARLVAELIDHQFSPDRTWRFYPYGEASNDVYKVAVIFMAGLTTSELPQFLSHEVSTIREKARELLTKAESLAII